jgi:hypothetical protein
MLGIGAIVEQLDRIAQRDRRGVAVDLSARAWPGSGYQFR